MTRRDWIALAVIGAAFAVGLALVDPRGNFPLDDDWDFAFGAWTLARYGVLQHTAFTVAIAVLQYCWGALWTLAFGQSFTVLRCSTLFLSLGTVALLYVTLRRLGVAIHLALFAALALLFHPIYFWASFTFMTHVPELFLSVVAFALLVEADRRRSDAFLGAAAAAAFASCLVRQTGVVNVIAPLLAAVIFRGAFGDRWKRVATFYGAALAAFAAVAASGALLVENAQTAMHLGGFTLAGPLHYGFFTVQYAVLFFLPLAIAGLFAGRIAGATVGFGIWFGGIAAHMLLLRRPIPYPARGNVFVNFALGPPTLRDTIVYLRPYPFHVSAAWLIVLMIATTVLAILAASMRTAPSWAARVALVYCACGTLIYMVQRIYFDRYSLDAMWPLAILIPLSIARVPKVAVAALVIVALFSVAGTAEYLSWNRARWTAYHWLQSRGVTLEQMDGGYEINALLAVQRGRKDLGKPGFGVVDDRYILTFGDVPGRKTLARFPYRRLLGADGQVCVVAR